MALPCTRLLILACSATKRNDPRYMPAIDRYDGPLWRTLRTVDPRREKAQVAFLSAHLGFRAADMPIEIYDARMTETMVAAMKRGDLGTRWPRPTSHAASCRLANIRECTSLRSPSIGNLPFATSRSPAGISISTSCGTLSICFVKAAMSPVTPGSRRSMNPSVSCDAPCAGGSSTRTGRRADGVFSACPEPGHRIL